MKKMVLLSLLVLSFPAVTFADTSDSVPDGTVSSNQEQVIESASVLDDAPIVTKDTSTAISKETQSSKENISADQESVSDEIKLTEDKEKTATESSADKTENSETAETEISTTNAPKAVMQEATHTAAITTQAAPKVEINQTVVEKEVLKEWAPDKIRENLKAPDYGISQTELKSYTDQELTNAFKLFARYNFDFSGMDLGSYVHVLRMVYKDNLMSWNDVEKALAFNPHNYQTTTDLAQNVDQLQMYLRVLHPEVRPFTNEELIYILNQMHGSEGQLSAAINLFSGVLNRLSDYPEINLPIKNTLTPVPTTQNLTAVVDSNIQTTAVPKIQEKAAVQTTAASQKEYPKTGEHNSFVITFAGIALFLIAGILILKRRVRS